MMKDLPQSLRDHPQCVRYFDTWQRNEGSIVFVPLAEILKANGLLEEACSVCEQGLRHNPDSISGRLLLASVYWAINRRDDAERMAAQVLARMPDHPEASQYVTNSIAPKPVTAELKPAGASDSSAGLWQTPTMADILVGQGEYEAALRILGELVQKDPKNSILRRRLNEIQEMASGEEQTIV